MLEALTCGTPTVTSRAGRNALVIEDGRTGGLFPLEDAAALQAAILRALAHPWERAEIARTGRQRSWAIIAKEVEQVRRLAIKNKPA